MSIFRRNKAAEAAQETTEPAVDPTEDVDAAEVDQSSEVEEPVSRDGGPFDVAEVEGRDGRIDLGALWVRGTPGMELRLEVEQETQQVNAATAVLGESALQLQAFAAPRSGGLWTEIRREIAMAVEKQGGTVEEADTRFGTQLRTRMPSAGPDGRTVFAPATFVGVDGPRWFLRAVLSGRAAIDDAAAEEMLEVLREIVVVRGVEPMAPRELLPLQLPQDARAEGGEVEPGGGRPRPLRAGSRDHRGALMGVRSRLRDLARTPLEQDADELHQQSVVEGGDDLTALAPRHSACVCGTVRTVTLPPRRSVPALVAEVWDGKGAVNLVWVGRRAIGGIEPGTFVRARGRVATFKGVPTIFNPAYEILPKQ